MRILANIIICLIISVNLVGQESKIQKIEKLMEIFGTQERMNLVLDDLINEILKNGNSEDSLFWKGYKLKFFQNFQDSIKPLTVDLYNKYFSENEIDFMYKFYTSDLGRETLKKSYKLMQDLMKIGMKYGNDISNQVLKERQAIIEAQNNDKINKEYSGCGKFKIGKFKLVLNDSTIFYYERDLQHQTETYKNGRTVFDIKWLNECRYEITMKETNNPYAVDLIGKKMIFNIYEIGDNSYKYAYQYINMIYEGELIRVE